MNLNFYCYETENIYFLESIENASYFQLDKKSFDLLRTCNQEAINSLKQADLIKKDNEKTTFNITCVMNSKCNLNCDYCFEKSSYLKKTNEDIDSIKEYIKHNLKDKNNIVFTGGEPLLSFKQIMDICELCEEVGNDNTYTLVTNGLLLNHEMLSFMDEHKFKIQFSIDGAIAKDNAKLDRTNIIIENKIFRKINEVLENASSIEVCLRVNFGKESIPFINEKVGIIKSKINDLDNKNLIVDIALIDVFPDSLEYTNFFEKINFYKECFEVLFANDISLPRQIVFGGDCMVRDNESILLDSQANIYPCFSFVGIEQFKTKHAKKEPLLEGCSKKCHLKSVCSGGCLYENYCDTNRIMNVCHKDEIDWLNKYLFLLKLIQLNCINVKDVKEEIAYVKTLSINF